MATDPRDGATEPTEPTEPAEPSEPDPRVRRRLAEVFGELPAVTSDELGPDEPHADARERDLLDNRPPHHDRD